MEECQLDPEKRIHENNENNPQPPETEAAAIVTAEDSMAAPSAGGDAQRTPSHLELMDKKIQPIKEQLQYLLSKADEFQTNVVYSSDRHQIDAFARVVPTFLLSCRPYFTYLESTARNSSPGRTPLPLYIRTQLLQFSEQLCSRMEQLLLMYASFGYLSLEEAEPLGTSHFFIGQCQVDNIKLSIFRYCCPAPFLASTNSGLHKRMRWNVELESGTECTGEEEKKEGVMGGSGEVELGELEEEKGSTEYYFLCCEDVPVEGGGEGGGEATVETRAEGRAMVKMWSIGQWVQTYPDPHTEDIYEWILCTVPQGQYKQILCLGGEEPSPCIATECLLRVLLSQAAPSINMETF